MSLYQWNMEHVTLPMEHGTCHSTNGIPLEFTFTVPLMHNIGNIKVSEVRLQR